MALTRSPRALSLFFCSLFVGGSHGFEIVGPHGSALNYTIAHELLPRIQEALASLRAALSEVAGVMIEDNKFALSVHTRNVSANDHQRLDALLESALEEQPLLRRSEGKHVIELRPQVAVETGSPTTHGPIERCIVLEGGGTGGTH